MEIVSQCRKQARRAYYGAVFEIKKELSDDSIDYPQPHPAARKDAEKSEMAILC